MKLQIILFLSFCFAINISVAQDSTSVSAPRIIIQKQYNQSMVFDDVAIKLVKVLEDSRCPKDVTCVRAGEAKILVEITEAGKLRKLREVIVPANMSSDSYTKMYSTDNKLFFVVNLLPYPNSSTKTELKDYTLQVEARKY